MKILITTDWYRPAINGVVTSVVNLADGLSALGHDVRVLTLSGSLRSHREGNVTYIGSVGVGGIYPNARLKAAVTHREIQELLAWKPDVVHSQCEFSTFFPAKKIAQACGAPLIHTYHTVYEDFTHYFSPSVRFGKYLAAAFSRKTLAKTQAVIVPTEKIKRLLQGYGVSTPIAVIPSGLALGQFETPVDAPERKKLRAGFGISDGDRVLLYLGRLAQEKNIGELLALLAGQTDSRVKLLLVGGGPYRTHLEQAVRALGLEGRVVFAGMAPPDDVARYYALGDLFVSASRSETQGLTYLEAMVSGLPLLCRDDPCLSGVIEDGVNGFLYADAGEFQDKLASLLDSEELRRSMGGAGRETAFGHFSARGFAESVLAVYAGRTEGCPGDGSAVPMVLETA